MSKNNKKSHTQSHSRPRKRNKSKNIAKISLPGLLIIILILFAYRYITTGSLNLEKINFSSFDKFIESFFETEKVQPKKITEEKLEYASMPENDLLIPHSYYTICYNPKTLQASWCGYYLSNTRLLNPVSSRSDDFREDENCPLPRATLDDYRKSGYDRGHLAPAADFKFDNNAMSETFYLSNISPQLHGYNAGIWASLEAVVRQNAHDWGDIYVTTGPFFDDKKQHTTIGKNKIPVPDAFYKALLVYNDTYKKAIGILVPHVDNENGNLSKYAMSIDELEKITRLDFFYNLPDSDEENLESVFDIRDWTMREYQK